MSWNKYNLYNMATKKKTQPSSTLYQQKWEAKKETRSYHGDSISERVFQSSFDPVLRGALGRIGANGQTSTLARPLASQTFASLERRLDVAIFRSMFASSVHQARQLVVHGKVELNGQKILSPAHPLQPGDMIHVDPEMVLKSISDYYHSNSKQRRYERDQAGISRRAQKLAEFLKKKANEEKAAKLNTTPPPSPTSEEPSKYQRRKKRKNALSQSFHAKPFMSPFAFIPSYLEVSHLTCSAIYLRHPVARPGLTEVPSPLPPTVHNLAYSFYTRGRR